MNFCGFGNINKKRFWTNLFSNSRVILNKWKLGICDFFIYLVFHFYFLTIWNLPVDKIGVLFVSRFYALSYSNLLWWHKSPKYREKNIYMCSIFSTKVKVRAHYVDSLLKFIRCFKGFWQPLHPFILEMWQSQNSEKNINYYKTSNNIIAGVAWGGYIRPNSEDWITKNRRTKFKNHRNEPEGRIWP